MWYYGVKIHILAEERPHSVPIPREILVTKASEHDLNAGKIMLENAEDIEVFADKVYIDDDWGYDLSLRYVELNTPFKERSKNQIPLDDGEYAWNAMISSRRQPIESFSAKFRGLQSYRTHVLYALTVLCSLLFRQFRQVSLFGNFLLVIWVFS